MCLYKRDGMPTAVSLIRKSTFSIPYIVTRAEEMLCIIVILL